MRLNKRGDSESFETFRLLIAFVLAMAVLVIIVSMINSTQKQSILVSEQKLKEGVLSAVKSAGTSETIPFVIDDLMLSGTISKTTFYNYTGLDTNCMAFVGGPQLLPVPESANNPLGLKIKPRYLKMNVYAYCGFIVTGDSLPSGFPTDTTSQIIQDQDTCPTYCVFFFNTKPNCALYNNINCP